MSGSVLVPRLRRWIGFAAGDTGRAPFFCRVGVTAVLARLVAADDFGAAALALALVTVVATFVGAPFEEALAQRRVLRRPDLDAALSVSLLTAVAGLAVCAGAGVGMALVYERADLAVLVPAAALLLFPLMRSSTWRWRSARRHRRRFGAINAPTKKPTTAQPRRECDRGRRSPSRSGFLRLRDLGADRRFASRPVLATSGAAGGAPCASARGSPAGCRGIGALPRLRPHRALRPHHREPRLTVVLNGLVGYIFGLKPRWDTPTWRCDIVEPVRGAVAAIGHNLTFAIFKAEGRGRRRARPTPCRPASASRRSSPAPVFMGLACVAPVRD